MQWIRYDTFRRGAILMGWMYQQSSGCCCWIFIESGYFALPVDGSRALILANSETYFFLLNELMMYCHVLLDVHFVFASSFGSDLLPTPFLWSCGWVWGTWGSDKSSWKAPDSLLSLVPWIICSCMILGLSFFVLRYAKVWRFIFICWGGSP